jgi:predicted nucleic acid-binding protein
MNEGKMIAIRNALFYQAALFMLVPVEGERLEDAARIGASQGLKLIDAIHLLAAIETECDIFITNDGRFRSSHGAQVVQISEL